MWTTSTGWPSLPGLCPSTSVTGSRRLETRASARLSSWGRRGRFSYRFGSLSKDRSNPAAGDLAARRRKTPRRSYRPLPHPAASHWYWGKTMIKPYTAVGLIPTVRGIRKRKDIQTNLEHLKHLVKAASWLSSLDLPVRLIAFPEGALQAFNDEVLDLDHVQFARECAIDIPGEETEELGQLARQYNAFIMAQAKARHPDWPERFFNVGFILDPQGEA